MIRRLLPIFGKNIFYYYLSALFINISEIHIELVEETEVSVSIILIVFKKIDSCSESEKPRERNFTYDVNKVLFNRSSNF